MHPADYPRYLKSYQSGSLNKKAKQAQALLSSCVICPRRCRVNRLKGEFGFCKTAKNAKIFSYFLHQGEEPPISGTRGSGTIFFSNCSLACVYCQNYEFSQLGAGEEVSAERLAEIMLKLQKEGAHNINLVTPTHVLPQILNALETAIKNGLKIPLVYNTSGYELAAMIKLLEGIVDIYLTDMRYGDKDTALKLSQAADYPRINQEAVKEMFRQTGLSEFNEEGLIIKGTIIRHLVLPNGLSGTEEIMRFIHDEISEQAYISLMSQYMPYHKAKEFPEISRRLTQKEYQQAKEILKKFSLENGWTQESYGLERFAGVHIKPKPA